MVFADATVLKCSYTAEKKLQNITYLSRRLFIDRLLTGPRVLTTRMQRSEDALEHISTDPHAGLDDELDEPDLRLRYQSIVSVAERTEREAQLALFVSLEEELVEQTHRPSVVEIPSLEL